MSPASDQEFALKAGAAGFACGLLCFLLGIESVVAMGHNGLNSMNIVLGAVLMVVHGVVIFSAQRR
ncbi:hypothetical protein ACQEU6_33300 [Spirillospora sp. CA-108201]